MGQREYPAGQEISARFDGVLPTQCSTDRNTDRNTDYCSEPDRTGGDGHTLLDADEAPIGVSEPPDQASESSLIVRAREGKYGEQESAAVPRLPGAFKELRTMWQSSQLAWRAFIQLLGRLAKIGAGVLAFGIASRTLGVARFGNFVVAFAYVLIFSTIATFGVDRIVIRDLTQREATQDAHVHLVPISIATKLLLAGVAMVLCVIIAAFLQFPGPLILAIALFSPYILVTSFNSNGLFGSILQVHGRSITIAIASTAAAFVTLGITAIVALLHRGVNFFLLGYTVAGGVDVLLCFASVRRLTQLGIKWDTSSVRYLLTQAFPLGVASVFVLTYGRVDTILLEKLTDPRQVALYGVAYKFFDVLSTISATIMVVVYPALSRMYAQGRAAMQEFYTRVFTWMLALSLPLTFAIVILRYPLVVLIAGQRFGDAQFALPGLMLAIALIFPSTVASYMFVVTRRQNWNLLLAISASVWNIGLNLWLIPRGGYVAAAWTTAATEAFVIIDNVSMIALKTGFFPSIRVTLSVLLAALAFGVALIPGMPVYIGGAIGLVMYFVLLLILGVFPITYLRQLVVPAARRGEEAEEIRNCDVVSDVQA
jgi:O-antigen/teichoic acid export membrane protein